MNSTLKLGLLLTAVSIISTVLYRYGIGLDFLWSWQGMLLNFAIGIFIVIYFGRKWLRDPEEGRLGYGQAVKKLFVAYLISTVLGTVFSTALFQNDQVVKDSYEAYEIRTMEAAAKMTAKMTGASEAQQEAMLDEMREQRENGELAGGGYPFEWSKLPLTILISAAMTLLLCLLLALFVREKETQYA